jgi:hypothetical protein
VIDTDDLAQIASYLPSPSQISHHGEGCCNRALSWLTTLDRAYSFTSGNFDPPVWLRRRFGWAPHAWPIFWCQVPIAENLDCGALAALATELFRARGKIALPVQLALLYPKEAIEVWRVTWRSSLGHASWISENMCYHEACALLGNDEVEIWDPTEGRWLMPLSAMPQRYGELIAIRIFGHDSNKPLRFARQTLATDRWTLFAQERVHQNSHHAPHSDA